MTTPFSFEGRVRAEQAELAIQRLQEQTDILIVVSNDRLLKIVEEQGEKVPCARRVQQPARGVRAPGGRPRGPPPSRPLASSGRSSS